MPYYHALCKYANVEYAQCFCCLCEQFLSYYKKWIIKDNISINFY